MKHSVPGSFAGILPRRWRRWGPRRRLTITRTGWIYLGFTLVIGLAAMNTGNNLLFLLLGLLLAGVILSGVLSEATLRGLSVERILPLDAEAGKPCLVGIRVTNNKPRQSSYAIIARDVSEAGETGRAFTLSISSRTYRDLAYRWQPTRRGEVQFIRVDLGTRFPFGLFEKWRECDLDGSAVVFPREVEPPSLLPRRSVPFGETPSRAVGAGTEFFALRDIRPGDDARSIHWATSARRGRPVVVERERERRRRIAVLVDNRPGAFGPETSGQRIEEKLDRLAENAAAIVRKALAEGCEVSVSTSDDVAPSGFGAQHERRLLRLLAMMGLSSEGGAPMASGNADVVELHETASAA